MLENQRNNEIPNLEQITSKMRSIEIDKNKSQITNCHKSVLYSLGVIGIGDLFDSTVDFAIPYSEQESFKRHNNQLELEKQILQQLSESEFCIIQIQDEPYYIRHTAFVYKDNLGNLVFLEIPDYGQELKESSLTEIYNKEAIDFNMDLYENTGKVTKSKYGNYEWLIISPKKLFSKENLSEIINAIKEEKRNSRYSI